MTQPSWLAYCQSDRQTRLKLFCFPYAGGSAAIFRGWQDLLSPAITVCPVELPGRGTRLLETPFTQLEPLVEAIATALLPEFDQPFALFGHSMGALIAFELARKLSQTRDRTPVHLFVSGRGAPHIAERSPIYHLSDAEFVAGLRSLNGTPQEVLNHPELMQMLIPALRADFTMADTYMSALSTPLECPITAFAGVQDPEATPEEVQTWQQYTSSTFSIHLLPGDHFFVNTAKQKLLDILAQSLAQKVSTSVPALFSKK